MSDRIKVLFVCVHNAARSRIAELYLKRLGGSKFEVTSAGFEPQEVNPLVIEVMQLADVPIATTHKQPSVFELYQVGRIFDYVISVCDEAQGQKCPIFPGVSKRLSWSFPDPSEFTGSHHEKLVNVVAVRNAIRARIELWLQELSH